MAIVHKTWTNLNSSILGKLHSSCSVQICGIKYFPPPPTYEGMEIPEKSKLKFMEKTPNLGNIKMPKMIKNLRFMRGPEQIHNSFIHKQYGIIALGGGRMRHGHFEMVRLTVGRKMDPTRMFAIWRVDPPWQPVTKKGQGQRMGGGKGAIDHYVTPIKADRVIIELGGKCTFDEVKGFLGTIAHNLPFKAEAISHEILEERRRLEKKAEEDNLNPYTFEYLIKNNMGNCQSWIRRIDHFHFGKYI
ncbi:mitochondrial ribosomal protein L16 [Rhodnius prolixus]|uniref:Large ribosomal subunit protein uL16m n=2 Tax=Rhodnius TaxID=13248 RepID=T1I4Y3_RHOPR